MKTIVIVCRVTNRRISLSRVSQTGFARGGTPESNSASVERVCEVLVWSATRGAAVMSMIRATNDLSIC